MKKIWKSLKMELELIGEFLSDLAKFVGWIISGAVEVFEYVKNGMSKMLYQQRGRFSQSFLNIIMAFFVFGVMTLSSKIDDLLALDNTEQKENLMVLSSDIDSTSTMISSLPKGEVNEYRVQKGETLSAIADKFGVSVDTIVWENRLKSAESIKEGQVLKILPITGVRHTVKRGETVYAIAKKYSVDPQNIIDYPFNSFGNDESFSLLAGQELMIPDGEKPIEDTIAPRQVRTVASIPGVTGEGKFMWPTNGYISQKYYWYHKAVDIANPGRPDIVAADSGTVVTVGWNAGGYGNYVIVDHGNGYQTLYAHMITNSIVVKLGQKVNKGQKLGVMGSTGRSTGTHLHFEVISPGGKIDPLKVLD